jgi:hypothetical protein
MNKIKTLAVVSAVLAVILFIGTQVVLFSDDHIGRTSKHGSDLLIEEIVGFLTLFSVPLFLWLLHVFLKRRSMRPPQVKQQPFESSSIGEAERGAKPKMVMRQINIDGDFLGYLNRNFQYITLGMLAVMLVMVLKQQSDISFLKEKVSSLSGSDSNLENKMVELEKRLTSQISNVESDLSEQIGSSEKSIQESLFFMDIRR